MNLIWQFFKGQYKVHCRTGKHARQIESWTGCERHCVYFYPDGHIEYDVTFPKKHLERVRRILACERSKSESDDNTIYDNPDLSPLRDNELSVAIIQMRRSESI